LHDPVLPHVAELVQEEQRRRRGGRRVDEASLLRYRERRGVRRQVARQRPGRELSLQRVDRIQIGRVGRIDQNRVGSTQYRVGLRTASMPGAGASRRPDRAGRAAAAADRASADRRTAPRTSRRTRSARCSSASRSRGPRPPTVRRPGPASRSCRGDRHSGRRPPGTSGRPAASGGPICSAERRSR
jgi:hypothetical protein